LTPNPFNIGCCPHKGKIVKYGMCARCAKRMDCRFRQQGTWVVECEFFREDPQARLAKATPDRTQRAEVLRTTKLA